MPKVILMRKTYSKKQIAILENEQAEILHHRAIAKMMRHSLLYDGTMVYHTAP